MNRDGDNFSVRAPEVSEPDHVRTWRPGEFHNRFQGNVRDLTPRQYETILFRDFDFATSSKSLVFSFRGAGIGDAIMAFETIFSLKEYLLTHSDRTFEFIGRFGPNQQLFYSRYASIAGVFDKVMPDDTRLETQFPMVQLPAHPHGVRVEYFSFGSMWDVLWGRWGLPGRCPIAISEDYSKRVIAGAKNEFAAFRGISGFPDEQAYVLLCPDGADRSSKKQWPLANWKTVLEKLLEDTPQRFVVLTSDSGYQEALRIDDRVTFFDYAREESNDLLRLIALVYGARLVLSVESGPAHVAGHLSKPCVVLWGPSNPVHYAHRNNCNIRMSACPPCWALPRMDVCKDNVCMRALVPEAIVRYVKRILRETGNVQARPSRL